MLRLNIRQLQGGPVSTEGTLAPEDPALADLDLRFRAPVLVTGELQATNDGDYLWRGHVQARVQGECRRCLADVTLELDEDIITVFSANPDLVDDPSVYPVDPEAAVIDVTPAVREEVVLRVSAFPLCRPECQGLCPRCGADLNAGPCHCAAAGSTN